MLWQCGPFKLNVGDRPLIMGVLNVSPDSFSDGYPGLDQALARAEAMTAEGADIIDVGGESTRPGSRPVPLQEELDRVMPVVEGLAARFDLPISIDTQKAETAHAAIAGGASIVNHVSGSLDYARMIPILRDSEAGCVCMHMKDRPLTMQRRPNYGDVVGEVVDALQTAVRAMEEGGVDPQRIVVDPGIGFGKTLAHNLALLNAVNKLARHFTRPMLIGVSRKSWLTRLLADDLPDMAERDAYTAVVSALLPFPAAAIHRVHNPRMIRNAFRIREALSKQE